MHPDNNSNKSMVSVFLITSLLFSLSAFEAESDSTRSINLDEISIYSNLKESGTLRHQPSSSTHISTQQLFNDGSFSMKGIGSLAPNFFMPDYGSKQSSAIYMRGVGSRIGTPAVGLYVDNVAYYDKSAFDFNMLDIESIDILRGPQSTLYGRNAMSGLIRLHTSNPFLQQSTKVRLGFAIKDSHRHISIHHQQKINEEVALSLGGFYEGGNGFFKNINGKKVDGMESAGVRLRAIYKPTTRLTLDANASYEYSDEGTYPYFYTGSTSGVEAYKDLVGSISANLDSKYRRGLMNASVNTEYKTSSFTLNSVTAFQNINDRMFMDQDFIASDIYSLEQKQNISTISEELLIKSNEGKAWNWLTGANIFYQWQGVKAPVTFRKDGVEWLNNVINANANKYMPAIQAGPMTMNFLFSDNIQGDALRFNDDFNMPTLGLALFHQSEFQDIMGIDGLKATLGLRVNYEKMSMDYSTWYDFSHTYSLKGKLSPMNREIEMVKEKTYDVSNSSLQGNTTSDFLQLLPKLALLYEFNTGNIYATVSRGYRSGGYNAQNISELLRMQMQTDMMKDVRDVTIPVLESQPMVPTESKEKIKGILNSMAEEKPMDVNSSCKYEPEYAWNYEIGSHLSFLEHMIDIDLSAFLIDVRNLQLSKMSQTGLGRTIINAGRSRSMGAEIALSLRPTEYLQTKISYGYTNATFRDYQVYNASNEATNCRGNHIPYVPQNTINIDLQYSIPVKSKSLSNITIGADFSSVGRIYWDETNDHSQSAYNQIGARVDMSFRNINILLWGKNLTNTKYSTFWFDSMNRGYEQHGKPLQFGVTAEFKI